MSHNQTKPNRPRPRSETHTEELLIRVCRDLSVGSGTGETWVTNGAYLVAHLGMNRLSGGQPLVTGYSIMVEEWI